MGDGRAAMFGDQLDREFGRLQVTIDHQHAGCMQGEHDRSSTAGPEAGPAGTAAGYDRDLAVEPRPAGHLGGAWQIAHFVVSGEASSGR
jgi:hypothetical protein